MNKHSGPLFQNVMFHPPRDDNFSNFFITPPKTFQLSLGVAGIRNTDFVTILPIFAAKRPDYTYFLFYCFRSERTYVFEYLLVLFGSAWIFLIQWYRFLPESKDLPENFPKQRNVQLL